MLETKEDFIEYCLRALGKPMLKINVTDEQVSDRVDDAVQLWQERHVDGSFETVLKHQVTAADIANGYINLPDNVLSVERVLPMNGSRVSRGMFNIEYQLHLNDIFDLRHAGTMANFVMTKQYLGFIDDVLNGDDIVEFSVRKNKQLIIHIDWDREVKEGTYIVVLAQLAVTPSVDTDVWSDSWLKRYSIALINKQWAMNLSKFSGVEMLGGVTVNASERLAQAEKDVEALEQELRDRYEKPAMFFIG